MMHTKHSGIQGITMRNGEPYMLNPHFPGCHTMQNLFDFFAAVPMDRRVDVITGDATAHELRHYAQKAQEIADIREYALKSGDPMAALGNHYARKSDDPLIYSDTGVYTATYNRQRLLWVVHHKEILQALRSVPWPAVPGVQAITSDEATTAGVAYNGAVVDTDVPTVGASYTFWHKEVESAYESYNMTEFVNAYQGGGQMNFANLGKYFDTRHPDAINDMLLADASAAAAAASGNRTNLTDNLDLECLDRVVSNDDEEDTFGGSYTSWFDVYDCSTCDRDTGTTYDAYVDHGSGTDRPLTPKMLDALVRNSTDNGAQKSNLVIFTKGDTADVISRSMHGNMQYGTADIQTVGVNGLTVTGIPAGQRTSTWNGVPIIPVLDFPADTIGRIMCVDLETLFMAYKVPTQLFIGDNPVYNDTMKKKAVMYTVAELMCTDFARQGKIRDLTAT